MIDDIIDYLRGWREMGDHIGKRFPLYEFILKHGEGFEPDAHSLAGRRGKPHNCYGNAGKKALTVPGLTYVEGFVSTWGMPIAHAWLIDRHGHVIEPTLARKNPERIDGYFGIPFLTEYLSKTVVRSKHWGIFSYTNPDLGKLLTGQDGEFRADWVWGDETT